MNHTPSGASLTFAEFQRQMEAQFERVIRIGAMAFGERVTPPPVQLAPVPASAAPNAAEPPPSPMFIKHLPERLDLEAARAKLPFTLRLPGGVPEEFERVEEVSITGPGMGRAETEAGGPVPLADLPSHTSAHLAWRHADGRGFNYEITHWPELASVPTFRGITAVPSGSVREVGVNGQPAALLSQFFYVAYPSQEVGIRDDAQLLWEAGGLHYSLMSFCWPEAGKALVAIAASIPIVD